MARLKKTNATRCLARSTFFDEYPAFATMLGDRKKMGLVAHRQALMIQGKGKQLNVRIDH